MAHKHRRTYEEMKVAHRERLIAYMRDLDRMNPTAWSVDFSVLRRFMHVIGAEAFLEPILFDLQEESFVTYDKPLRRGVQIYLQPKWRT